MLDYVHNLNSIKSIVPHFLVSRIEGKEFTLKLILKYEYLIN